MFIKILDFIKRYIEIIAIIFSPVIAVLVGELLRRRNYKKQQKDNLVKHLLSFGYQISLDYKGSKEEILTALNEIKYWYSKDKNIKERMFDTMNKMAEEKKEEAQDSFIELMKKIGKKEGHDLTREDIERVFSQK